MIRRLIILLLIVGCVFGDDELKDRRTISFDIIASLRPNNYVVEGSDIYKWVNDTESNYNLSERVWGIISFSIFYIKPNSIGGYLNYGQQIDIDKFESTTTELEAKEKFIFYDGHSMLFNDLPRINQRHFEIGITYQPINNLATYSGISLKNIEYINYGDWIYNDGEPTDVFGGYSNSNKQLGLSLGILLIPYQTKQYSGLTFQLGYSHSFGFGGGFDLGIGYRL